MTQGAKRTKGSTRREIGLLVFLLSVSSAVLLLARDAAIFADGGSPPPDYSRFIHATHNEKNKKGKLDCRDCHAATQDQVRLTRLPPHNACMRCHVEQFTAKDQKICAVCHTDRIMNKAPQLKEFPDFQQPTQFQMVMNHKVHVDPNDPAVLKFHMLAKCEACHKQSADAVYETVPGHAECQECHNKPAVKPAMADCAGCHKILPGQRAASLVSYVRPVAGKFSHQHHEIDAKTGERIECVKCHASVAGSKALAGLKPPPMDRCTDCHNGEVIRQKVVFSWGYCLECHMPAGTVTRARQPWPDRLESLEGISGSEE